MHILLGMPAPGDLDDRAPWEVAGGCCIGLDSYTRRCTACSHTWSPDGTLPAGPTPAPATEVEFDTLADLLRYAECDDISGLEEWIDNQTELYVFVHLDDEVLIVGFHDRAVGFEFPVTLSNFWESVIEVEDEVLAEMEDGQE